MKPIVIAGNGPSLAQIDYSRLPNDFDMFRCNQFYFEDKYFLGKKIRGFFLNSHIVTEQIFTAHYLIENEEYEIENFYCRPRLDSGLIEVNGKKIQEVFPFVYNTYEFLKKDSKFFEYELFYRYFFNQYPTMGIVMLYTAIIQGYREIYLTGIDFYDSKGGGRLEYAFSIKEQSILCQKYPDFSNEKYINQAHTKSIDQAFIQLALSLPDIKLYAISPNSALSEILPLAPTQSTSSFRVENKPEGYICDLIIPPQNKISFKKRFRNNLKKINSREINNIYYNLIEDLCSFIRAFVKALRGKEF